MSNAVLVIGDKIKVIGHVFGRSGTGAYHLITNMSGTVKETGKSEMTLVQLRGTRARYHLIPTRNLKRVG